MSKIIRSKTEYQSWTAPAVDGDSTAALGVSPRVLEEFKRQARREGFNQGYREGKATGEKFMRQKAEAFERLMRVLSQPLADMDERVEQELVNLSVSIARQIIRREIKTSPDQIMAVVREALQVLPVSVQKIRLRLHPDDLAMVREMLPEMDADAHIVLEEDPSLDRGDLEVFGDDSYIDATLETRIARLAASLWGGERKRDV